MQTENFNPRKLISKSSLTKKLRAVLTQSKNITISLWAVWIMCVWVHMEFIGVGSAAGKKKENQNENKIWTGVDNDIKRTEEKCNCFTAMSHMDWG